MTDPALPAAVDTIASFEGFRSHPYQDQGGAWTIGYGFTVCADGSRVCETTPPLSEDEAKARLSELVARVLARVRQLVAVPITVNQAVALASFAFNEGTGALSRSTLLERLNAGDVSGAAEQFRAWVYVGGKMDHGLVRRRAAERELFLTPDAVADDLNAKELATLTNGATP